MVRCHRGDGDPVDQLAPGQRAWNKVGIRDQHGLGRYRA
jgi:hypothetical protein